MKLSDFDYHLPHHLIAQYPLPERTASRLMCLEREMGPAIKSRDDKKEKIDGKVDKSCNITHRQFTDVLQLINPNDVLIFNNSRVIRARLFGRKESGGQVEVLVERVLDDKRVLAHVRASKSPKAGNQIFFEQQMSAEVISRQDDLFELQFLTKLNVHEILEKIGHIPLPPYIERGDKPQDSTRYQTVYADPPGSVAAPTAGLHFDEVLLQKIAEKGVEMDFVTLHVGAGTFQPVRVEDITQHHMHHEYIEVPASVCEKISKTKERGGRVIAVGTTTMRSLESAAKSGNLQPFFGKTDIFIYPGFKFNCVDVMITNFHLPKSSLLMLVCAFAGYQQTLTAYEEAIKNEYRFFSYGDAMWVERNNS